MSHARHAAIAALAVSMLVAEPAGAWRREEMRPSVGSFDAGISVVEAHAPSKAHPWGTIYAIGAGPQGVHAVEWDMYRNRLVGDHVLGAPYNPEVVHAVRRGDRIEVVVGSRQEEGVLLIHLDSEATVLSHEFVGYGSTPSLAVDDDWIAVGWYVAQPDEPVSGPRRFIPRAFHVDVFDRKTHTLAGARVFRNGSHVVEGRGRYEPGHAIALLGGHAYFALQDENETFVTDTKLPALNGDRRVSLPGRHGANEIDSDTPPIYAVGSSLVVLAHEWIEVSPTFDHVVTRGGAWATNLATNASGSYVLLNALTPPKRPATAFLLKPRPFAHALAVAWGHPVYIRLGDGRDADDGYIGIGP